MILECASGTAPVLLVAEHGTGKTSAARRIHAESSRADGPLIAVRCRDLSPGNEGAALILGREAGGRRESGGIHLAHEGTLVLRDADTLEPYLQMMLARHLQQMRSRPAGAYPDTRVILTARADTVREGTGSGLEQALLDAVETVIRIPALADRPRDIVPLAEEFLKAHGKSAPALTESAKRALASLSFRRRNVRELREVVDLAVRCADGPEIRAEHIFGGVAEEATPGIDITSTPVVRRLLRPLVLGLLRGATLLGFVAVIVVCLAMPGSWAGRNANAAIWSVWEPAVFGLFLLAGPVWCTVCPLSTAARWLRRVRGSDRPPPAWLQRHGPWIAVAGFAAIVWSEHVFDTLNHARASGLLLGCLLAAATIGVLAYQREVWCRYLCPLGRLGAALAPAAPLQIAANPRVCASSCTSHACYKGAAEIPGCTVFHHPLEARQAYRCKLCLDCLKSCPHGSARLQIRPPLAAVWSVDGRAADIALFGVAVSLLALVLVAARAYPVIAGPARFTLLCVLALLLGSVLHRAVLRWAGTERRSAIVVRASVTLMVLGWSALMVGQLGNVPTLAGARLELEPAAWMPAWMPTGYSVLTLLQIGLVAIGFLLSSISLDQIRAREGRRGARAGWALAFLGLMAYAGGVLALALA